MNHHHCCFIYIYKRIDLVMWRFIKSKAVFQIYCINKYTLLSLTLGLLISIRSQTNVLMAVSTAKDKLCVYTGLKSENRV